MTKEKIIPRIGYVLRAAIKAAGYRVAIENIGLDKDLDDFALESRPGVTSELMQKIEEACSKALTEDCGNEWAHFLGQAWFHVRKAMQDLVQHVDASPLNSDEGSNLIFRHFTVPMLSVFLRLCFATRRGPDIDLWWKSPFQAWVHFASSKTSVSVDDLLTNIANHLAVDQRSIERWIAGEPVGKIGWPYCSTVEETLRQQRVRNVSENEVNHLVGWLLIAVAFQSLPAVTRDAVRRDMSLRTQEPWSLGEAISAIKQQALEQGNSLIRREVIPILGKVEASFALMPRNLPEIQLQLDAFHKLIQKEVVTSRLAYQYIHDWFSARLAALQSKQEDALLLYEAAVSGIWWSAGPNHKPILNEALLYAVGVGDKVAAEQYWDKTFVLGLNRGPKRPLDEQELRRISFGFEKMFFPQKAKARIPPRVEVILRDEEFSVSPKQLANPNQKAKFAEGRTRRTPLMDAIREGTLDDVKRLLKAGGDPNDFIKESGESPLSYAMRRACDRKDPLIMDYLLSLDLLSETVNRPASTKRETPLKIAVEMANAKAVSRLIVLGANVEKPCDYLPSALCYAMVLFHGSLHRDDPTQELVYLMGKSRADVYDAKDGAVLDVDLAVRRQSLVAVTNVSQRHRQIFEAVKDYFIRPADNHRQVIQALLKGGANANRRYKVEPHHLAEWTPTLFAAEVGDIEVFKMLVEHSGINRGDPDLTLMPPSALERFDALWVAIDHGRHAIVSYLMDRQKNLQQ